jgi:hypothetical protein
MACQIWVSVHEGEKSGMAVVETGREEAKAQLQEALDKVADACTSSIPQEEASYYPDIQLSVSWWSMLAPPSFPKKERLLTHFAQ